MDTTKRVIGYRCIWLERRTTCFGIT